MNDEEIARAYELVKQLLNFVERQRTGRALWSQVDEACKRHYKTSKRIQNNWAVIESQVPQDVVSILRKSGQGSTYTGHLRSLFKNDVKVKMKQIMAASVH